MSDEHFNEDGMLPTLKPAFRPTPGRMMQYARRAYEAQEKAEAAYKVAGERTKEMETLLETASMAELQALRKMASQLRSAAIDKIHEIEYEERQGNYKPKVKK